MGSLLERTTAISIQDKLLHRVEFRHFNNRLLTVRQFHPLWQNQEFLTVLTWKFWISSHWSKSKSEQVRYYHSRLEFISVLIQIQFYGFYAMVSSFSSISFVFQTLNEFLMVQVFQLVGRVLGFRLTGTQLVGRVLSGRPHAVCHFLIFRARMQSVTVVLMQILGYYSYFRQVCVN